MEERETQRRWAIGVPTVVLVLALVVGAAGGFWLKGRVGTPGEPASIQRPSETGSATSAPLLPPGIIPTPPPASSAAPPVSPAPPPLPSHWEVSFAPFPGFETVSAAGTPGSGGALRMEAQEPAPGRITALGASRQGNGAVFGAMGGRVFWLDTASETLTLYTCPVAATTLIPWLGEFRGSNGGARLLGLAERRELWLWPTAGREPQLLGLYPFPGWVVALAQSPDGEVRGCDADRRFFRLKAMTGEGGIGVAERWDPDAATRAALLEAAPELPPAGMEERILAAIPGARGLEALVSAGPAGAARSYLALVQAVRAFQLDPATGRGADLGPAPNRTVAQCADQAGRLYVLAGGRLYRLSGEDGQFQDLGRPPGGRSFFGPLALGPGGRICAPFWFSYDAGTGSFEALGDGAAGGTVLALTLGPDGALYGGTDQGGRVFRLRPGVGVEWLGPPLPQLRAESGEEVAPITALAAGPDGLVYGVVGKGAGCRTFDALFRLDPRTGRVVDWFRVYPGLEELVAGPEGRLYGAVDGRVVRLLPQGAK
ncbi:MAG: hypothetical protein K6T75_04815 [Acetobacteraceae bacterium]|nr:hypothetical protein [Acetobacteraceae bacterium]